MIIVKNRELLIPNNERYIGTTYDNDTENRVFQVPRFSQRGVDLANLTFRLDIQYANESYDTVVLDKEVGEAFIILIWRITSATLQVPGTLYIGLRAIDDEATVKWSSFSAAMYAERHLNTPGNYGGSLTEIEQMEQDHQYMKNVINELKDNLDYAHDAEAWAQGTRSGTAVPSTDKTYHKNSKYYADQANTKATAAANSATAAANSATQAAETVSDTNARFNNAMAAVTSETEVIDARVGADGTTYPVLKTRLDTEHTQLKSALDATIKSLNYFDSHSLTEGYTRVQDGVFSPTSGFYDSNLIRCYPGSVFFVTEEKKMESQSLPQNPFVINFFDENGAWLFGSENYTSTVTEITAEASKYGFGGWMYQFTIPDNANIAFWSRYYTTDIWNGFGLFCFYDTADGNYKFAGETPVSALYHDESIPIAWVDKLPQALVDISENIISKTSIKKSEQLTYEDMTNFDLGYVNASGAVVDYANAYVSDYIRIIPGTKITYNLFVIINIMYGVTWYDANKSRIGGITLRDGREGTWGNLSGEMVLPETALYIKINARKMDSDSDARRQTVIYVTYETIAEAIGDNNPWIGKTWYAFGTSITDTSNTIGPDGTPTGKYVPYLAELSGMIVTNYGIAGGTIGNTSTGNILTRIKNTDLSGADLITLEGFVNDFVGNLPLGTIGDTDNSTFAGALYDAITYMQSNSDATIVLITETTGRNYGEGNFVVTRANTLGAYQYQFNDMIKTMCNYLGVHCIDAGQKSQINQWNPQYLADWIHHTELGGKQYAETIWEELKNIHCNTDVVLN